MLIGYARVSKADGSQSLDLQRDALRAAGVRDDLFRLPIDPTDGNGLRSRHPHASWWARSPPWRASACCIRSSHLDQDVAEPGVDASFEFVFMPERDEES